jgi:hypothetical protein
MAVMTLWLERLLRGVSDGAWRHFLSAALVIVAAVVVLALIPEGTHKTVSQAQRRRFDPVCASSGHLVSVVRVDHAVRPDRGTIYRVHCSGGLTTEVAR